MEQIKKRTGSYVLLYNKKKNKINLLVIKYNTRDYGILGGGLKKGETPEECAEREIFEETGLKDLKLKDYQLFINLLCPKEPGKAGSSIKKCITYL